MNLFHTCFSILPVWYFIGASRIKQLGRGAEVFILRRESGATSSEVETGAGQGSRLLTNVAYNFLSQIWFLVLTIVTSPYIVHKLGTDAYGVLSVVAAVMGYLAVLDLGMGAATIKYIADYYAERNFNAISKVIGTSLVIYSGLGVLGTLLIAGTAELIVTQVFHIPANMVPVTLLVFYVSSVGFLVNMPLTVFNSIPNALQRFDILVKRNLLLGTATVIGQVTLLALGFSLREIVILNVAFSIIGILVFVIVSRRLLPDVSFKPALDVAMAKRLVRFSAFKVFSVVSGQVVFHFDRFLIAVFLPIANVSYYVVPLNLAQRMLSLIPNITTAVFPAVSGFQDKPEQLRRLYLRSTKSVLMLMLPVTVVLVVFAEKILAFWMGADFAAQSSRALQLLAVSFLLASFSAVPCVFAEGLGKPELPALFAAVSAALNLLFALTFIPRYGIAGPAMALIANALLQVPVFVDRVNRKLIGVSTMRLVRTSYAKPIFSAGIVSVLYLLAAPYVKNLIELGGLILIGSAIYLVLCLSFGALDPDEKEKLKQYWTTMVGGPSKNAQ